VGAIDKSRYGKQKGRIYAVDTTTKAVKKRMEGIDALTLYIGKDSKGDKILLVGNAMRPVVTALSLDEEVRDDIVTLPDVTMRVRKIKIDKDGTLHIQAIPFSYTLIAAGTTGDKRVHMKAVWDERQQKYVAQKSQ
jgi:hypothetical protein